MLMIVGLGNPGRAYAGHRHNVGWMAVEAIADRQHMGAWRKRFGAEIAEGRLGTDKAILVKPLTYMNESGQAAGAAARFYQLEPKDIVVIHDEIDLAPGKTRLKVGGGAAGHNGLRSVTAHIGNEYRRLRIGVGHPDHRDLVHRYVLHDFARADREWLDPLLDAIGDHAPLLAEGKDALFANRLHDAIGGGSSQSSKSREHPKPNKNNPKTGKEDSNSELPKGPFASLKRLLGSR